MIATDNQVRLVYSCLTPFMEALPPTPPFFRKTPGSRHDCNFQSGKNIILMLNHFYGMLYHPPPTLVSRNSTPFTGSRHDDQVRTVCSSPTPCVNAPPLVGDLAADKARAHFYVRFKKVIINLWAGGVEGNWVLKFSGVGVAFFL